MVWVTLAKLASGGMVGGEGGYGGEAVQQALAGGGARRGELLFLRWQAVDPTLLR